MKKYQAGIVLILMMLGHNYVINQPQSLQKQIEQIHSVNVTQFNLLYSIPSILALLTIIPVGILYHKYPNFTILFGVGVLFIGQLIVSMFGSEGKQNYFKILIAGRTLQASGAEVLYMIQGNLASSWMSNLAGLIFILPQVGEIMNAFFTPYAAINWGVKNSLWLGVIFCFISTIACCYLYCHLKKLQKTKKQTKIQMMQNSSIKYNNLEIEPNSDLPSNHETNSNYSSSRQQSIQIAKDDSEMLQRSKKLEPENKQKTSDQQLNASAKSKIPQPETIFKAGKIFWLTILICAINECLYFPFLDNANELIQMRFKIPYQETGYFLCLPFIAAILTALIMSQILGHFQRKNLVFYTSFLPFIGHLIIVLLPNCEQASLSTGYKILLALGFFIFGTGIGGYYSVSFPAVGMAVPQKIRGLSYGVLGFCQTFAMSMVPIFSGLIIEEDITNETEGYRHSSMMFVMLTVIGMIVAFLIKKMGNEHSYFYDDQAELIEEHDSSEINWQKDDNSPTKNSKKVNVSTINTQIQSNQISSMSN